MIIAHLTSVHPRFDSRIYYKMCKSLNKIGKVYLICADGKGDQDLDNIEIIDVGKIKNRFFRIGISSLRVYKKAILIDADIYHLHDPELIPIGLKLVKKGKKVIFDSHEDVGATILEKKYLNKFIRNLIYSFYKFFEKYSLKKFNGLIAPTPFIKNQLLKLNSNTEEICNYPIISEFISINNKYKSKKVEICFIGGISQTRGVLELIKALEFTRNKVYLNLAGNFISEQYRKILMSQKGWKNVNYYGYVTNRKKIIDIYQKSMIGIVTLLPSKNDVNSLPIKMFEYMNAKLPIIASDFEYFKTLFKELGCGINVDPRNYRNIAKTIDYLVDNPNKRYDMAENGYKAVINNYNWKIEEKKLINFYKNL